MQSSEIFSHPDSTRSVEVINRSLSVSDTGFLHQVMGGSVENHTYKRINAHSHAVGAADQELSALGTAGFGNWPSAAAGVVIVSDDAEDAAGGDGATSVIIRGLDSNWEEATATIIPTGATPTTVTTQTFIRINEIEVMSAGSVLSNAGNITASISGSNIIRVYAEHTNSESGRYTIPAGHEGHFQNIEGSARGNKEVTYHIFCRDNTIANAPFRLRASWHSKDGGYRPNGLLDIFTEKTDVIFTSHADTGAAASASIEGWIETTG